MKKSILLFCLVWVGVAGADPDDIWNREIVDGHTFNYSISDYGWRTVGTIGSSAEKTASKGLAIRYSFAESEPDKKLTPQMAARLTLDAVQKCGALAASQELEQQKEFPADMKVRVQSRVITAVVYDSVGNAGFSCALTLSASR